MLDIYEVGVDASDDFSLISLKVMWFSENDMVNWNRIRNAIFILP